MYLNKILDSANDNDSCYTIDVADHAGGIQQLSDVENLLGDPIHRQLLAVILKWLDQHSSRASALIILSNS